MSPRSALTGRLWKSKRLYRYPLLVLGVAAAGLALWTFYFRPWLGGISGLDAWLDRNNCLIPVLCTALYAGNQVGLLAAMVAVLCFGLAFWRWPVIWVDDQPTRIRLSLTWRSWRTRAALATALLALGAVAVQAYQVIAGFVPRMELWLVGIGGLLAAAIVLDSAGMQDLKRTLAHCAVAIGMGLLVLGTGCLVGELTEFGRQSTAAAWLLPAGSVLFSLGIWWTVRSGSAVHPVEHVVMLIFSVAALLLAMSRAWDWRSAWIGDEWAFFDFAQGLLHRRGSLRLLGLRSPNDFHTILSSAFQAGVMKLAGENVFGWRLSSVLPFALSVPPVYVLLRWLAGQEAALLGAGLFVSSHVLLTFPMVAYNNTQALLPLTLSLGFFVYGWQRPSFLRFLLAGLAIGFAWFSYGLARLAVLPLGLLLIAYAWRSRGRRLAPGGGRTIDGLLSWASVAAGGLAVAAPIFFNHYNWQTMLKATPVHSELFTQANDITLQMLRNGLRSLLAFLVGSKSSHFVAGPLADPLTALLILAGLGAFAGSLLGRRSRARSKAWRSRAGVWLLASGLFVVAVGAIQQFNFLSNTRMFILPPIHAIFAGLGGVALASLLLPKSRLARGILYGAMILGGAWLNIFHVEQISLVESDWPPEALLIQQLQDSAAADGGGMPVFVVAQTVGAERENQLARGYDVGRERLVLLEAEEALESRQLCLAGEQAAMALIPARDEWAEALRQRVGGCWTGSEVTAILNQMNETWFYRLVTEPGQQELRRPPASRRSDRQKPDTLAVPKPGDVVIDSEGTITVLSRGENASQGRPCLYRFAADGKLMGRLPLEQEEPTALALTPEGLLVVTSRGSGSRLVWYDGDGTVAHRAPTDLAIGDPQALSVAATGELFVADGTSARVVHLSSEGAIIGEFTGGGRIAQPASVALGLGNSLWVLNARGDLLHISPDDEVLASWAVPPSPLEHGWRVLPAPNGDLLMADPATRRVIRRDPQGYPVRVWSGFGRPRALALDPSGRLFVSDYELDQVAILPALADAPWPTDLAGKSTIELGPLAPDVLPTPTRTPPVLQVDLPFEPDFFYVGDTDASIWIAGAGTVTVVGGRLTVQVAAVPGSNAAYDYLGFLGPDGSNYRFEAEDTTVTTGDAFSRLPGQDNHWWLQEYVHFSDGFGLVVEQPEEPPVLTTTVSLPDGEYQMSVGTFTGDTASGAFALAIKWE